MTNEEKQAAIQRYIAAYNSFDVDGMLALVDPDIVFKNISGSEVTAEAEGIEQFRALASKSRQVFSSRHQRATNFRFDADSTTVEVAFEAVLAVDLPNGKKAGEKIRLDGRTDFEFKDGKLSRITDFS
jgi:ketosteroid isomerase-like protein